MLFAISLHADSIFHFVELWIEVFIVFIDENNLLYCAYILHVLFYCCVYIVTCAT